MLGLVAENAALEDALYYLDLGVTDSVITVEVFLKEIRRLARKQFVARATMKKVKRKVLGVSTIHSGRRARSPHPDADPDLDPDPPPLLHCCVIANIF